MWSPAQMQRERGIPRCQGNHNKMIYNSHIHVFINKPHALSVLIFYVYSDRFMKAILMSNAESQSGFSCRNNHVLEQGFLNYIMWWITKGQS